MVTVPLAVEETEAEGVDIVTWRGTQSLMGSSVLLYLEAGGLREGGGGRDPCAFP